MHAHEQFVGGDITGSGDSVESKCTSIERGVDGRVRRGVVDDLLVGHGDSCRYIISQERTVENGKEKERAGAGEQLNFGDGRIGATPD